MNQKKVCFEDGISGKGRNQAQQRSLPDFYVIPIKTTAALFRAPALPLYLPGFRQVG